MKTYDLIVIGGGPAGSASAIFLAQRGYRVALLDRANFPRDKVCGEFISPGADAILDSLGVLDRVNAACSMRLKGIAVSSYETEGFSAEYPDCPKTGRVMTSLSLDRMTFDPILWEAAGEAGAERFPGFQATDLILESGRVVGVKGWDAEKTVFELRARAVVDAGGRNAISLRRLGLKREHSGEGKVALAAHWDGVYPPEPLCYMHVSRPGYTGLACVGPGRANIVLVVDQKRLRGESVHEFYVRTVLGNPLRAGLLAQAQPSEEARTIESLAFSVQPPKCGGLFLVGDASGFIDPFTGEGIYLSLRSAQLACETIADCLDANDFSITRTAAYEDRRRAEFGRKFFLSRALQFLLYRPVLCKAVTRIFARNADLASRVVGVIGDYIEPASVVAPRFLLELVCRMAQFPAQDRAGLDFVNRLPEKFRAG
ncbi:MAG: NAD(P)/FAD-dependent oxidoreductase [Candidatus Nitrohelix vancouverensis]|uniref:NAD(P)/FAD-dependent oxidoreductase n=1 Tax=Candidatus Nitrohelix vancouverensis TaxID=2705534 RepID=A0A7T0C3C8_9BACT|nr:MAG: NAD(P)/FAD-dependent oxidoreductase [Candidatus Nitrohelix vancouverensis]